MTGVHQLDECEKNHLLAVNWLIVLCSVNWLFGCPKQYFHVSVGIFYSESEFSCVCSKSLFVPAM